jgi:hypothetical protein
MMAYKRYISEKRLTKSEKISLLKEFNEYYEKKYKEEGLAGLTVKIPRNAFDSILDQIGTLLIEASANISKKGTVRDFLDNNPVPDHMKDLLPIEFRAFSLILNALKQWVSAESAATDRYLLGGTARTTCRSVTNKCIVTNEEMDEKSELHHLLRDGRPPILLSKKGHELVEEYNQNGNRTIEGNNKDANWEIIKKLRSERNMSWVQLREGCNAILGNITEYRPNAKSFANKVIKETGLSVNELIELLDQNK